jgi:hypothetical protein
MEENKNKKRTLRIVNDPCITKQLFREKLRKTQKLTNYYEKKCEEQQYNEFIKKYFIDEEKIENLTNKKLLNGLMKYYKDIKNQNIETIVTFNDFIQKFPQKIAVSGTNYKRQHIFEALCRILLFFNYDNGEFSSVKTFYNSLESYLKGDKKVINNEILEMKVNESSSGGIVDIFFKTNKIKDEEKWGCEMINYNEENQEEYNNEYIMIQNKYYDKERTDISNYDVTKIYSLINTSKDNQSIIDGKIKIILMVNNEEMLLEIINKSKRQYDGLITKIYGVSSINNWFQKMIYDLYKSNTIDSFIENSGKTRIKREMETRFHQKLIINTTVTQIENGKKKYIWGAVPRSGKSYMIGGLISERYKKGSPNNIVLILGAKTETESQFIELFKSYSDFEDYTVITNHKKEEGKINIYILSQEWFKSNKIKENIFDKKVTERFPRLFDNGVIDLYFDEIHNGGSTDNSESILHAFNNSNVKIDLFVMVTATFAKPNIRYVNIPFIDNSEKTELIEWSYEDQQNMKKVVNETAKQMMINSKEGVLQNTIIYLFEYYKELYGSQYLTVLSGEYKKHPELVLITPEVIDKTYSTIKPITYDIRNLFINNLICTACKPDQEIVKYKDPRYIFNKIEPINDLLDYISLTIYNYFKNELLYKIDGSHTELWFLPDKDLYNEDCKEICNSVTVDENMDEEQKNIKNPKSIANIEPLSRGLAIKICQHEGFTRYNVLIVHNTKIEYIKGINENTLFNDFHHNKRTRIKVYEFQKSSVSLSNQIKNFEIETYKQGKSLIVLTGAKLRLGISLPCADIGFNFDNIKSIDNNYQTMFRVLTEREKPVVKNYGYYIDFNKERSIQFLYEYNKIYSKAKNVSNVKESVISLQSLLFTFHYNGLQLFQKNSTKEIELYNILNNELNLNEKEYTNFYIKGKNFQYITKNALKYVDENILQQIAKILQIKRTGKIKNNKIIVKEGKQSETMEMYNQKSQSENEVEDDEEQEVIAEIYSIDGLIEYLSQIIPSIVVLLALYSKEIKCENITECIKNSIKDIEDLEEYCNCNTIENANVIECFMNSPYKKYDKTQIVEVLKILLEQDVNFANELNFIYDNIKEAVMKTNGENLIYNMTSEEIDEKIIKHLDIREEEKNKFGEVFTPKSLIDEMMDALPNTIWSKPDLKWLDPASGIGNFFMVVYQRLMDGLEQWKPNKQARSSHILKNMLYMVEINAKNIKMARKIFGKEANISCADFLEKEEKWKRDFNGVDKFDVIVGNPPFQTEQDKEKKTGTNAGRGTLWDKFIEKSLVLLKPYGYLGFINPPAWRKPEQKLYDIMTKENQLLYLHIYSEKNGQKLFNVGSKFDLYVIQKRNKYKNTEIIDELDEKHDINVSKWCFLPNYQYKNIMKIITDEDNGIDVIYDTLYHTQKNNIKDKKTETYKYPIVHSINEDGIVFWYSDVNKGQFGVSKVLLNFNRKQYPINDYDGKYGMSQLTFGIPITSKKQGDEIVKAINTDEFKEIIKATKWGAFQTEYKMFKYFKPDFYKSFTGSSSSPKQSDSKIKNKQKTRKQLEIMRRAIEKKKTIKNSKGGKRKTIKKSFFW